MVCFSAGRGLEAKLKGVVADHGGQLDKPREAVQPKAAAAAVAADLRGKISRPEKKPLTDARTHTYTHADW